MNADPIARAYRWLEYATIGFELEDARFDFLSQAAGAQRVMILGEGDGRFLARLLECNPHARVAVIESSARMIDLARRRLRADDRPRVDFHCMDAAACPLPDGPFDLAVTHFFFDILESREAESVILKVDSLLDPGACWLLSEFQVPSSGIRRLHARLWLSTMYGFFSVTTGVRASQLSPYREVLVRCGWVETDHRERRLNFIRSQVWRKATSRQTAPTPDPSAPDRRETPGCA